MTEQQYNDLLHALGKEAFSEMVKADLNFGNVVRLW